MKAAPLRLEDLSLGALRDRAAQLETILTASRPTIHTITYGTFDELWCNAEIYWLETGPDQLTDFVQLWRHHLEQVMDFEISELPSFFASLQGDRSYGGPALFTPLSPERWAEEKDQICEGIREAIARVRSGQRKAWHSQATIPDGPRDNANPASYWGIFVDRQRVDERDYTFEMPGQPLAGLAIRNDWNQRELMLRTDRALLLFVWSTGA